MFQQNSKCKGIYGLLAICFILLVISPSLTFAGFLSDAIAPVSQGSKELN